MQGHNTSNNSGNNNNGAFQNTGYDPQGGQAARTTSADYQLREALARLAALDSENTDLRNQLIDAKDEIFMAYAGGAVAAAEAKTSQEGEIAKLKSELNFRVRRK